MLIGGLEEYSSGPGHCSCVVPQSDEASRFFIGAFLYDHSYLSCSMSFTQRVSPHFGQAGLGLSEAFPQPLQT